MWRRQRDQTRNDDISISMSCALLDLFKTVITNAFRKVLHGKQIRSTGLEVNGKIRDQRDDLIRRRMEMKNISENQLLGLQRHFDKYKSC